MPMQWTMKGPGERTSGLWKLTGGEDASGNTRGGWSIWYDGRMVGYFGRADGHFWTFSQHTLKLAKEWVEFYGETAVKVGKVDGRHRLVVDRDLLPKRVPTAEELEARRKKAEAARAEEAEFERQHRLCKLAHDWIDSLPDRDTVQTLTPELVEGLRLLQKRR